MFVEKKYGKWLRKLDVLLFLKFQYTVVQRIFIHFGFSLLILRIDAQLLWLSIL